MAARRVEYGRRRMRPATRISGSGAMQRPIDAGPRRSPVPRRSRNTVAAILDAAARIFAKHGYARGTTNRIAERAGVSIGSLYEYFPSKDAILIALTEAHIAEAQGMLRETTGRSEERRVGKECGWEWRTQHEKKR